MKRSILPLLLSLVCMSYVGNAQDPVKTDPSHYKVLLETPKVRVLEAMYKPGEKSGMHYHPYNIVYFLGDFKGRFTMSDGTSRDVDGKSGECIEAPAGIHAPENIGNTNVHVIIVELKEPAKKKKK